MLWRVPLHLASFSPPAKKQDATAGRPWSFTFCALRFELMLVIRFQRVGRKNDPAFRIVVTEKRSKPKSGEREIVGSFHPKTKATTLKPERISYWLSKGAKTSPRVHNLLVAHGLIKAKKIDVSKARPAPTPPAPPLPQPEPVQTKLAEPRPSVDARAETA